MELKTTEGNILYNENKINELMNSYASTLRTIFSETFDDKTKRLFYTSNVVGEYAELLVSSKLHLTKEIASKKDYDATDSEGKTYQIKSRWYGGPGSQNGKKEFGSFKKDKVDYLVLVVFFKDFSNLCIYLLNMKDFDKILEIIEVQNLKKIFGKETNGSRKCYFYEDTFKILCDARLMKEIK